MKRLLQNSIVALSLVVFFGHCREPYNFKTTGQTGLLVVDGIITDQPGPYFLNLATTNTPGLAPLPLPNALVTITDERGNADTYQEIGKGKYKLNGLSVFGRPGGFYTLHINLPDGRKFESNPEKMPTGTKPADSAFVKVSNEKVVTDNGQEVSYWTVNAYLNTTLPENTITGLYRWSVAEVWNIFPTCFPGAISCPQICYIYESISKFNLVVIKSSDYSYSAIKNLLLMSRGVDFSFNGRHYFNVTQYSMNPDAYKYWSKVEQLITKRGSIFDTPPSIIPGNIRNIDNPNELAFGYFEASAIKVTRTFIDRGSIPTYIETCFYYAPDFNPRYLNRFCFNCQNHEGSTIVEPDWFW